MRLDMAKIWIELNFMVLMKQALVYVELHEVSSRTGTFFSVLAVL